MVPTGAKALRRQSCIRLSQVSESFHADLGIPQELRGRKHKLAVSFYYGNDVLGSP